MNKNNISFAIISAVTATFQFDISNLKMSNICCVISNYLISVCSTALLSYKSSDIQNLKNYCNENLCFFCCYSKNFLIRIWKTSLQYDIFYLQTNMLNIIKSLVMKSAWSKTEMKIWHTQISVNNKINKILKMQIRIKKLLNQFQKF